MASLDVGATPGQAAAGQPAEAAPGAPAAAGPVAFRLGAVPGPTGDGASADAARGTENKDGAETSMRPTAEWTMPKAGGDGVAPRSEGEQALPRSVATPAPSAVPEVAAASDAGPSRAGGGLSVPLAEAGGNPKSVASVTGAAASVPAGEPREGNMPAAGGSVANAITPVSKPGDRAEGGATSRNPATTLAGVRAGSPDIGDGTASERVTAAKAPSRAGPAASPEPSAGPGPAAPSAARPASAAGAVETGGAKHAIPSSEAVDMAALNEAARQQRGGAGQPADAAHAEAGSDVATPADRSAGSATLEEVVREALGPVLKSWLDENLPRLIEEQLRAEVQKAIAKAKPGPS